MSGERRSTGGNDYYGRGSSDRGYDEGRRRSPEEDRRHSSDSRGGRDRLDDDDWKCVECRTWNYPEERRCDRCGLGRHHSTKGRDDRSSDSDNSGKDEFGRRSTEQKKKEAEWPPCFKDNSDEFMLDARSGMFYETNSDFFYDPTSKLYYGNKKGAYFSYNADTKKFDIVDSSAEGHPAPPAGSIEANNDQDHLMLMPNGANNTKTEPGKKVIAIKLKTITKPAKKRKKRSEATGAAAADTTSKDASTAEPATKQQKLHAANMENWHKRGLENPRAHALKGTVTKDGKPICWLCKRKFPSFEKLQLHEAKSKLHEENLAKKKKHQEVKREEKLVGEDASRYMDRAQQRRDMHGPEFVLPAATTATPVQEAQDTPTGANIGHQMLEKLGWKAGKSLGRGTEHQQEQQAALAQDWDRIENMAAKNNRR